MNTMLIDIIAGSALLLSCTGIAAVQHCATRARTLSISAHLNVMEGLGRTLPHRKLLLLRGALLQYGRESCTTRLHLLRVTAVARTIDARLHRESILSPNP